MRSVLLSILIRIYRCMFFLCIRSFIVSSSLVDKSASNRIFSLFFLLHVFCCIQSTVSVISNYVPFINFSCNVLSVADLVHSDKCRLLLKSRKTQSFTSSTMLSHWSCGVSVADYLDDYHYFCELDFYLPSSVSLFLGIRFFRFGTQKLFYSLSNLSGMVLSGSVFFLFLGLLLLVTMP